MARCSCCWALTRASCCTAAGRSPGPHAALLAALSPCSPALRAQAFMCCVPLSCVPLPCLPLPCLPLPCVPLPCVPLHCVSLSCVSLPCVPLYHMHLGQPRASGVPPLGTSSPCPPPLHLPLHGALNGTTHPRAQPLPECAMWWSGAHAVLCQWAAMGCCANGRPCGVVPMGGHAVSCRWAAMRSRANGRPYGVLCQWAAMRSRADGRPCGVNGQSCVHCPRCCLIPPSGGSL